jgi:hypothetical protein
LVGDIADGHRGRGEKTLHMHDADILDFLGDAVTDVLEKCALQPSTIRDGGPGDVIDIQRLIPSFADELQRGDQRGIVTGEGLSRLPFDDAPGSEGKPQIGNRPAMQQAMSEDRRGFALSKIWHLQTGKLGHAKIADEFFIVHANDRQLLRHVNAQEPAFDDQRLGKTIARGEDRGPCRERSEPGAKRLAPPLTEKKCPCEIARR